MNIRLIILSLFLFGVFNSHAQRYMTSPVADDISTIQISAMGNWGTNPIIKLNSKEYVTLDFDRLGEYSHSRLKYNIYHCDLFWQKSKSISEIDYLDGFNGNLIDDYKFSTNTSVDYTHFKINFPNKDIKLKLSGNYLVEVYEDGDPDYILLYACFSVVDDKVQIGAEVSSITDIDANKGHQQLSFSINHRFNINNPSEEILPIVRQNNRLDNQRIISKPNFVGGNKITYQHNAHLIFEAGNEYRRFETISRRYNGLNVDRVVYQAPYYYMDIREDKIKADKAYSYDQDQNGRFAIRNAESSDTDTEADYFYTDFTLSVDEPLSEDIYINGEFTNNTFSDKYKMVYDEDAKAYRLSLLLKQGLYNYQYMTPNGKLYTTSLIEGQFHQTDNEYDIYVYYKPSGQRYDALIGMVKIQARAK